MQWTHNGRLCRRERKTPQNIWGLASTPVAQKNSMPGEGLLCRRQHPLRNFPGRGGAEAGTWEVPGQQKGKGEEGPSLQEDREDWGLTRNKGVVPRPVSPQFLAEGNRAKTGTAGFPGGSVAENPPTCRRHGFHPWSQKIPRAAEQLACAPQLLSLCLGTTTAEPPLHTKRSHSKEKPSRHNWRAAPAAAAREKPAQK